MIDVKFDKVDGSDVYLTINCYEDSNANKSRDVLRLPVRKVVKPPVGDGKCKDPTLCINGMNWPSFAEYVTKNLSALSKNYH